MKQAEVEIGQVYAVKVSGTVSPVRVDGARTSQWATPTRRKFTGTNLRTGKTVSFTAAKCRYRVVQDWPSKG